jgi:hypothetical protein
MANLALLPIQTNCKHKTQHYLYVQAGLKKDKAAKRHVKAAEFYNIPWLFGFARKGRKTKLRDFSLQPDKISQN